MCPRWICWRTACRNRCSYGSSESGIRSFTSKKRGFTLFTLTRIAHPLNSPRTIAYPVIDRHSGLSPVEVRASTEFFALISYRSVRRDQGSAPRPAPVLLRRQTAVRTAARSSRPLPAALRVFHFPVSALPPVQEFYRLYGWFPSGARPQIRCVPPSNCLAPFAHTFLILNPAPRSLRQESESANPSKWRARSRLAAAALRLGAYRALQSPCRILAAA